MSTEDIDDSAEQPAVDQNSECPGGGPESGCPESASSESTRRQLDWPKIVALGVLPGIALALVALIGFLRWQDLRSQGADLAVAESMGAARDTTVAILSYKANTVDKDLNSVRDRLTGSFLDAYIKLVNEVVIPGSREKGISAVAKVPAVASVSASRSHAVVLVFVNQTVTVGKDTPTTSASSVRVTLDKVGDRWLVSGFDPV